MRRIRAIVFNKERGVYEPKTNEEDVVEDIMTRLAYSGFKVYREKERIPVPTGKFKMTARGPRPIYRFAGGPSDGGHPDLHGWIPRHMFIAKPFAVPFYIEAKNPNKNRHRPKQEQFILEAKADGVIAFFAESWNDVKENFSKYGIIL
jgi:hypothetical protein